MSYFVAIDVETANRNPWSVCQIGLAAFASGVRVWSWSSLVNPEEPFERGNVGVHGIMPEQVAAAPRLPEIIDAVSATLAGQVVASHGRLDCDAIHQGAEKHGRVAPTCQWLDTAAVARAVWPDLPSHKLAALAGHFGIPLQHHDAEWDAVACGEVLAQACRAARLPVKGLAQRVGCLTPLAYRPREVVPASGPLRGYERVEMQGAADGPLRGHVACCTGDFSIGKRAIAEIAAGLGCDVEESFSAKRTTLLITGRRDAALFGGKAKSEKMLKAEAAIAAGRPVTVLSEHEFLAMSQRIIARRGAASA